MNSPRQVLFASLIGTTIEFFDFYIYATAAVLVFPRLFFPTSDPASAVLASLATFGIAFVARPIGSAIFGHFGDRVGRKATLVAALLTMGVSTVTIGLLPTYETIGVAAPALLALCRFGQGLGLGGEWGGAVLLAVENAPPGKRAWYGMFPQLGAPIGFLFSGSSFLALSQWLTNDQFLAFGWRIPFLASAVLVAIGLYIRLTITETPVFQQAAQREERAKVPMLTVIKEHPRTLVLGTLASIETFVLFYLMTVFSLSWGTSVLGYSRNTFLVIQLVGVVFFALAIPVSAIIAERGRRATLIWVTVAIGLFGLVMAPLLTSGLVGATIAMIVGLSLMGLTYGPLGTTLSELFPTRVRYTGSSLTFNLAGIFGASLAPYIATWLAQNYGLQFVGYYVVVAALLTLVGLVAIRETKDQRL
ncbi:MAG TPA: MFS transporter [Vicinamibacterales bacterium]|nr:MFS transporter [Vicinamibacterales bacterium]